MWPLKYYAKPFFDLGPVSMFRRGIEIQVLLHFAHREILILLPTIKTWSLD